jgi:hypothetical protein
MGPKALIRTSPSTNRTVAGGEHNGAWGRQLLHARRQMGRLPHRRVIHMQVIMNGAHHHFPGVQANTVLEGQVMGAAHLLGIVTQRRLHGQGGVTGPQGVILVGQRGA